MIKQEVRVVLAKVHELGEGDVAQGAVRAFEAGVLDVPFAPSVHNAGRLMPVRDNEGAVRILEKAKVPMDPDVEAYHRQKIAQRAACEHRETDVPDADRRHLRGRQGTSCGEATMKIRQALFSRGVTGFFFDDQKAIKGGLAQDGFVYLGKPVTDGVRAGAPGGRVHLGDAGAGLGRRGHGRLAPPSSIPAPAAGTPSSWRRPTSPSWRRRSRRSSRAAPSPASGRRRRSSTA